jgi:peptide/nickel transport system permease protein
VRNESAAHMMFCEILPSVRAVVLVELIMRLAYAVFAIATLNFIGVGVQRPTPDWGRQILEHYFLLGGGFPGKWAVAFPALGIATLVVGLSLIADGLTDVLER